MHLHRFKFAHRWFLLALTVLLASSCGWQLRGSFNLPPQLTAITIDGEDPYSALAVQLRELLNSANIATPDNAPYVLYISEEERGKNRFTQNRNVLFDEFMLTHTATYELRRQDKSLILEPKEAVEMTLFQDDQSTADTKLNEENILRDELAQKLAVKILRKIQSVKPAQWTPTAPASTPGVITETLPGQTSDLPTNKPTEARPTDASAP